MHDNQDNNDISEHAPSAGGNEGEVREPAHPEPDASGRNDVPVSAEVAVTQGAGALESPEPYALAKRVEPEGAPQPAVKVVQAVGSSRLEQVEPTDQSFIFAHPGESGSIFVADDESLSSAAGQSTPVYAGGRSHPVLDVTETPDPAISWRTIAAPQVTDPLSTGVLHEAEPPVTPQDIYATDPGLFGPGFSDFFKDGDSDDADKDYELVLGVKFREYGSVYFFRAGHEKINTGGQVLVETEQGMSLAEVVSARKMRLPLPKIRTAEGEELEIKPITGLAGPEDIAAAADNRILASGARMFCKQCIRERDLDMKLVDVEVLHDRSKIIFYFTAPTRIDFRELVKDLVRNYRTRIELRQIGVRHETQMLGALGNCGMACCCRRYLRRFAPVTIKMAKEQNLFLNPAKLSGICGRLLCCLANEQENYEEFHRNSPKLGKKYQTSQGMMKVVRANLFRQSIVAVGETGEEQEFQLDEWHALDPVRLELKSEGRPDRKAEDAPQGAGREAETGTAEEAALPPLGAYQEEPGGAAALEGLLDTEDEQPKADRGERRNKHDKRSRHNDRQGKNPRPRDARQRNDRPPRPEGPRSDEPRQGENTPRPNDKNNQRQSRPERSRNDSPGERMPEDQDAQNKMRGDSERLKVSLQEQDEQGRKTDAPAKDKSIFGLPGSRYGKD